MIIDLAPFLYLALGIDLLTITMCMVATYFILRQLVRRSEPRLATQKGKRLSRSARQNAHDAYGLGRA